MQNVDVKVTGNKLTISIDLNAKTTPSASGKSEVIASTRGNTSIVTEKYGIVNLGVNLFKNK